MAIIDSDFGPVEVPTVEEIEQEAQYWKWADAVEEYAAYVEMQAEAEAEEEAAEAGHPVGWYEPTCTCSTCRAIRGSGSCRQQLYRIDPKDEQGAWAF